MKIFKRISVLLSVLLLAILLVACGEDTKDVTVTFKVDNEVVLESKANKEGIAAFPEESLTEKEGFEFIGWYDNENAEGVLYEDTYKFDEDITLHANYEEIEPDVFNVKFVVDGEVIDEQEFTDVKDIEYPELPEKEGYEGKWEDVELSLENMTINAIYTAIEYTITFVDENDDVILEDKFTVETEDITLPDLPEKEGYEGKWEDFELGTEDLVVKATYEAIEYTITFLSGEDLDVKQEVNFTIETMDDVKAPTYIVRVPGHSGKWEDFDVELKDMEVKAKYEEIDNYVEVHPEADYMDAQTVIDEVDTDNLSSYLPANGLADLQPVDGNEIRIPFADGQAEIVSGKGSARFWQIERVDGGATNYNYDGHRFTGMLKFGGQSHVDGRYIKLTPKVGATISLWILNPGAVPEHEVFLLNELRNPVINTDDGYELDESIIVDRAKTTSTAAGLEPIEFNLIGGQTYYIWNPQNQPGYEGLSANKFIRGIKFINEPTDVEVTDIKLNTDDVLKEFPINSEITYENLKVSVFDKDNNEYEVTDFTVEQPDTSTAGEVEVEVKYGKTLVATYKVEILEDIEYTAYFKDGDDIIKEVVFSSNDTELSEIPEVPTKDGYESEWESFTLPASEDLEIQVIYTAIDYIAQFYADDVLIGEVIFGADHPTNIDRVPTPKVPFKQGFTGKWESYKYEDVFSDQRIDAIYTDNSDEYVIKTEHDSVFVDGRKLRDKAIEEHDLVDLEGAASGNIQTPKDPNTNLGYSLFFGENDEFEFGINRAIQFDRAETLYSREQEEFYGRYKTGGASHPNDRWIKISPVADARLSVFGLLVASSVSPSKVWLLNDLKDPTTDSSVIIKTEEAATTLRNRHFDLEGGQDYYLWFENNTTVSGFRLVYNDETYEVDDMELDTTNVKTEFNTNDVFTFDDLVVTLKSDDKEFILLEDEYTVVAPDMSEAGTKEVTVKYGENRTKTYTITIS